MSKPKYLPIPKKIPYNIRMPQHLLDKLNAYAELTGNTTTDVVIGALNDFRTSFSLKKAKPIFSKLGASKVFNVSFISIK